MGYLSRSLDVQVGLPTPPAGSPAQARMPLTRTGLAVARSGRLHDRPDRIGQLAVQCLHLEVDTYPKPGLVSHIDSGSHQDMGAALMRRSADVLAPFLTELAAAGACGASLDRLRAIGIAAECAMLDATGGVNTHRGAIFGMGLLAAAAGFRSRFAIPGSLGRIVARCWGPSILRSAIASASHGAQAARLYGVGGARAEAAAGFPSLYDIAVPALVAGEGLAPYDPESVRVHGCMALIAAVDDTNLLHRGGLDGLIFAQRAAAAFLNAGSIAQPDWKERAVEMHGEFIARKLSPGGCADLLSMALFVRALE